MKLARQNYGKYLLMTEFNGVQKNWSHCFQRLSGAEALESVCMLKRVNHWVQVQHNLQLFGGLAHYQYDWHNFDAGPFKLFVNQI